MIFEYNEQSVFTKSIDVVDIGNTAIRATSEEGIDYYIITKTVAGKTSILKFGPILADVPTLLDSFSISFNKIDYKENKIALEITKFINDYKKKIDTVAEILELEAFEALPNIEEGFNEE